MQKELDKHPGKLITILRFLPPSSVEKKSIKSEVRINKNGFQESALSSTWEETFNFFRFLFFTIWNIFARFHGTQTGSVFYVSRQYFFHLGRIYFL